MLKTLAFVSALLLITAPALAFHDDGVARCSGCHTMHNSEDGALVDADSPNGNAWLLTDATPSDVCLGCHAYSRGAVLGDGNPANGHVEKGAGNFVYLLANNLAESTRGSAVPGDAAGHNLNAPGFGLAPDATLSVAPGGTFPASQMSCTSCHDPHGSNNFRLLYGGGRVVQDGVATFTNPAPAALGNSYNTAETQNVHTAYLGGMGAWCGNCHGDFHSNNTKLIHPSGRPLGGTIANNYNLYNGTADMLGGDPTTSYLTLVPFEDPNNSTTSTAGPTASSQVSCISCHRAHGSSSPDAGRWDFQVTFLHEDGSVSDAAPIAYPAPYDGVDQRSLCNKCHVKDAYDLGSSIQPTVFQP